MPRTLCIGLMAVLLLANTGCNAEALQEGLVVGQEPRLSGDFARAASGRPPAESMAPAVVGRSAGNTARVAVGNDPKVRVKDIASLTLEIVSVKCAGECADVVAVARGGNPPYAYHWEDGATLATRRVCPDVKTSWTVTATDTEIPDAELPYDSQLAQARVTANALVCDAPPIPCEKRAAESDFDPIVKWKWTDGEPLVTPLVANLTDDNGDGAIDLKDTPDIVLNTMYQLLVVLDGRTGKEHLRFGRTHNSSTPALGDIDGDRRTDIVAILDDGRRTLGAFHADGTPMWSTPLPDPSRSNGNARLAIADLDHDGSPEILAYRHVFNARGEWLWSAPTSLLTRLRSPRAGSRYVAPIAADLDDDGYLEVIYGGTAYRHDGAFYYENVEVSPRGYDDDSWTAIGNFEGDLAPEIVVSNLRGLFMLDHRGATLRATPRDTGWVPPAIHDLDGDGVPEILLNNGFEFTAHNAALDVVWAMPVMDGAGSASGTAFDFLGDGTAEAIHHDAFTSTVFDGRDGHVIFMQSHVGSALLASPTVADVDNDGSADLLLTSAGAGQDPDDVGLQVISDRMGRWSPARRIMNQDSYHVTNVNEDGTIPIHEDSHWKLNNSFRAQAAIHANGTVCVPKP